MLNGWPLTDCGILIQLYHHSFGNFLCRIHKDTEEILTEHYLATHTLLYSSAALYDDEAECQQAVQKLMDYAIGHHFDLIHVEMNPMVFAK